MGKKTEKLLKLTIFIGSILILFLPLFVYRGVLYPYIFSKIIIFQILVEIIFVAWLVLMIYKKEYRPNFKNPLVLSLTIFIGALFLIAITGVDFQRSFWSTQERMTGVLTMLHFYAFFIVLISVFKEWKDWRKLIWASLICSFFVGLYGLGQQFGLEFLLKGDLYRLSSTLGNPIYLGVYSLLHIFLAGFLLFREKKWLVQGVLLFLTVFYLLILILSSSRGALVALLFSSIVFLTYFIFGILSGKRRILVSLIFVFLFAFFIGIYIFLQTSQGESLRTGMPYYLRRFLDFKIVTRGIEQRTIPWQIGLDGFRERPILGWGWENFNIPYNKYYRPEILKWGEPATWFDRSHNQVVDIFVLTGILGGLAYLIMYGSIFWLLFKKRLQKLEYTRMTRTGLFVLGCMFLAYFIQNLTVFDTPGPLIVFYFGLGLVYFMTKSDTNTRIHANDPKIQGSGFVVRRSDAKFPMPILILLIVIFLPWAMYKFNIEPWQQSSLAYKAGQASQQNLVAGLDFYKEALAKENVFSNPETRGFLAKTIAEQEEGGEIFEKGLIFAISEMEKNVERHPYNVRYWLRLGQLYNFVGETEGEYLEKAEKALIKAKELSPQRQAIDFEMVKTKIYQQNFDSAINLAQKTVDSNPDISDAHRALVLSYLAADRFEEGLLAIEGAGGLIDIYKDFHLGLFISTAYFNLGNIDEAIEVAEKTKAKNQKNVKVYIHLAILYKEAGEKEKAVEAVRKAVGLEPSLAVEGEIFIKSLDEL